MGCLPFAYQFLDAQIFHILIPPKSSSSILLSRQEWRGLNVHYLEFYHFNEKHTTVIIQSFNSFLHLTSNNKVLFLTQSEFDPCWLTSLRCMRSEAVYHRECVWSVCVQVWAHIQSCVWSCVWIFKVWATLD